MSSGGSLVVRQPTRLWPTGCHLLQHSQVKLEAADLQASETAHSWLVQANGKR